MKKGFKGKTFLSMIVVMIALAACVGIYAGFLGKPQTHTTTAAFYGGASETIDATGTVRGNDEKTYYATVTAPIALMDIEIGDSIPKDTQVVTYDLSDLTRAYDQAVLTAEAGESGADAQIRKSNEQASKYAKAATDEQTYQFLYALSRMDSDKVTQDQYSEAYQIQCAYDSLTKNIAVKSKQVAEKTRELANMEDKTSEAYQNLAKEIADLNVSIAGMQKDQANLPNPQMTPDENAHVTYDSNLMEDITRNWTQATTDANTSENQIMNEDQKKQLQKNNELARLNVQIVEEDLAKAGAGVATEFSGVVTKVLAEEGAVVTRGMPLFSIEDAEHMRVDVELSKYDVGKVTAGQPADIEIAGRTYTGTVSELKRLAVTDASDKAKVTVEVTIDNPDDSILIGIEADVDIHANEKTNVLLVPIEAYYSDDEGDYCYVIENGVIAKKYVTTGLETDTAVEITDGLKEGELVITDAVTDDQVGKKAVSAK